MKKPKIFPNAQEAACFKILREAAEAHGVTLRVAGGWCRDKLLARESHDIDIAIDRMTGQQFAREVLNIPVSVVPANPDQSKHLETAKIRVGGFSIDLANLRDETGGAAYTNSRILNDNIFASAEVDASRRDFTIGALFYNLHTGEVEDYVGGLRDLGFNEDGEQDLGIIIRTPLPPRQTFMDDPLRILRGLRFMTRFDAILDKDIEDAISDPVVLEAFEKKLSAERIAVELLGQWEEENGVREFKRGILNNLNGVIKALSILIPVGLLDRILYVPLLKDWKPFDMDQKSKYHRFNLLNHTLSVTNLVVQHPYVRKLNEENPERAALLVFSAILHDLGKRDPECCQVKDDGNCSYHGHEESSAKVARDIANKLKLSNDATDYVVSVCDQHMSPHGDDWGKKDKTLRKFMARNPDHWEDIIVLAFCDCLGSGVPRTNDVLDSYDNNRERCKWLLENDPVSPITVKPALAGEIIMGLLPEMRQGPWIRHTVQRLNEIRFEKPSVTQDELIALVTEWKPDIVVDPQYVRFRK